MIVVDSSVWIPYLHGFDSPAVRRLEPLTETNVILVGDLILLEVLQGARSNADARLIERELAQFNSASMLSTPTAVAAARNYRELRRLGYTIRRTTDLIIGTFCIRQGHQLLQQDRDFEPMQRLGLELA